MSVQDWGTVLGIAGSAAVVAGSLIATIRWFIKHEVHTVRTELQPNGGSSFRDHIDRRFDAIDDRLNGIDDRLSEAEKSIWQPK